MNIPAECSFEFTEVTAIDCSRPFLAKRESLTGDAEDASSRSSSSTPLSPILSIVVPFLNEEAVLPLLWARIQSLPKVTEWEFIFVSDGSTDRSVEIVSGWAAESHSVKLIELSRNFGHQAAISAGLTVAAGEFVGVMDADLQDEPEVLLSMFEVAVKVSSPDDPAAVSVGVEPCAGLGAFEGEVDPGPHRIGVVLSRSIAATFV